MIPLAAAYAALCAVVVLGYPTLRGDPLLWLYTGAELLAGLFAVWCYLRRVLEDNRRRLSGRNHTAFRATAKALEEKPAVSARDRSGFSGTKMTTACGLALISASLTTSALPALAGPRVIAGWPVVVAVHGVSLGVVLAVQCWELLGEKR